ncbi:MAG TPA: fumarylacetoacetate hydrolase family protein [Candidatus Limnocylindria bacterium]|nr:fumarylacetoacetate hydrolase family protein [Candidatus Limnocylindria bacterium]
MKVAHVREQNAPVGEPLRLAAALDPAAQRWLDLEVARRRVARRDERLAHNSVLFRQPLTTLDDHLARGLRVDTLQEILEGFEPADEDDDAVLEAADLRFGPPIIRPTSLRDFYAFERHVATMWQRRGQEVPQAWYRLPVFYFSNVSEVRGPLDPVWAPRRSKELDYELEIAALIDTPVKDLRAQRGEEAIGGYTIFNDWSARDLQRDETTVRLGPAKGKDFASTLGPWLVTPDELADVRSGKGFDLAATADVNGQELSRGRWSDVYFTFGEMIERASEDVRLIPGDVIGSGTVGTGCLLEIGEASGFGRYLQPGDQVTLKVERLGELSTPIVDRPVA